METGILEIVGQVAGIGGIAFGIFLLIFREVIRKNIFPTLTREQSYKVIRLLLTLTFLISLFGITAWLFSQYITGKEKEGKKVFSWNDLKTEYYEPFDTTFKDPESLKRIYGGVWRIFENDPETPYWSSAITDNGYYCLKNDKEKQAVHYIHISSQEKDLSESPVSMEVMPSSTTNSFLSSAGILYRFDKN